MLYEEKLTSVEAQIADVRKALDKLSFDEWCDSCSDDFFVRSGKAKAYDDKRHTLNQQLKALESGRELIRERLNEYAYWD